MLKRTFIFARRGQPNPPRGDKHQKVPMPHRPFQGGQQHFQHLLLQRANQLAARDQNSTNTSSFNRKTDNNKNQNDSENLLGGGKSQTSSSDPRIQFPEQNVMFQRNHRFDEENNNTNNNSMEQEDKFVTQRSFNDRDFYDRLQWEHVKNLQQQRMMKLSQKSLGSEVDDSEEIISSSNSANENNNNNIPRAITSDKEFRQAHGFSLLKTQSQNPSKNTGIFSPTTAPYSSLDLWGEQPQYGPQTYFLYLIARRRNAYAVIFDHQGKRVLPVYSVGNRGLKESDKGFRVEGSAENAHQVTSQYLSDALPKIREIEHNAGRDFKNKKIELVVRVLGFYNGRQGAIRAVTDHSDVFEVKYLEDVTPFPLNGPRMPRARVKTRD